MNLTKALGDSGTSLCQRIDATLTKAVAVDPGVTSTDWPAILV